MEVVALEGIAKTVTETGFAIGLTLVLLWYVFKHQEKLDIKSDKREETYQTFITMLQGQVLVTAEEGRKIVKEVNTGVDALQEKVHVLSTDVDRIKVDVTEIKANVQDVKVSIEGIKNATYNRT